ncbi:hypothetical protein [Opitutus sp. GAS368]|uniref:hypothetical protein n=1 Tax=Opitutus sp. GAS368 TaxID=1882749 RepID=UPI00087C0FFB|nr:hypothetical protein [Opitutus sp. GAS368]SDS02477.1 hypothetical protein SAMN05444173_1659 [Opitutus sp. GAS368]
MSWFADNWFTALQTLAIVSGFAFTCITLRRDARSRRVGNLFQLTAHHHDVWAELFKQPELRRVLSARADLDREPVTDNEALFVGFLILHLSTAHQAIKQGLMDPLDGLGADIRTFFARPVPRAVWQNLRQFQDAGFVAYVEGYFHERAEN